MKKLHKIEITVCPVYLAKQKQMLYSLMELNIEWTDEMHESMYGLFNFLDYIEDKISKEP
jgi:hypothetical protein